MVRVNIVVDVEYGQKLAALRQSGAIWAVDSTANRLATLPIWNANQGESHLTGITLFSDSGVSDPEELLLNQIDMIDLHHGELSSHPSYSCLWVVGAKPSPKIDCLLKQYGFRILRTTKEGFEAVRL